MGTFHAMPRSRFPLRAVVVAFGTWALALAIGAPLTPPE